jgi:hypothetical protein
LPSKCRPAWSARKENSEDGNLRRPGPIPLDHRWFMRGCCNCECDGRSHWAIIAPIQRIAFSARRCWSSISRKTATTVPSFSSRAQSAKPDPRAQHSAIQRKLKLHPPWCESWIEFEEANGNSASTTGWTASTMPSRLSTAPAGSAAIHSRRMSISWFISSAAPCRLGGHRVYFGALSARARH